jgi:hypothetical protein
MKSKKIKGYKITWLLLCIAISLQILIVILMVLNL